MDNKQKTLLGVLGALVIGMGAFWVMSGDDGPAARKTQKADTGERRVRERVEKKEKPKRSRERKTVTRAPTEKRERDVVDRKRSAKKKRGRRGTKEKKKKIIPAA